MLIKEKYKKNIQCLNERELHEECGVFGVFNVSNASYLTYYGLHSLQHRGQEGAGIATVDDNDKIKRQRAEGLVSDFFTPKKLDQLNGKMAIGHVRYSTSGGGGLENVQPILIRSHRGDFVVAYNGNIVNALELRTELELTGSIFHASSDTEIIGHLIQRETGDFKTRLLKALPKLEGAFSFLIMNKDELFAIRDKNGFRPLSMARLEDGYVFSSESSAFEMIGASFIREIEAGELLRISKNGLKTCKYTEDINKTMCAMEYIYFSRPDSDINNLNVHISRQKCGELLAKQSPSKADIVIGVPDSSLSAAMGYAKYSKIPYELGLVKSRYVGRTFISPTQAKRAEGVKMKLSAMKSVIKDKKIVLVDDSIVRGTTSKHIIQILKDAGAKEVHMKIASPAIISPCFYGVDTSTSGELISNTLNAKQLGEYIGADSLEFMSVENLKKALGEDICMACFTRNYPTKTYDLLKN